MKFIPSTATTTTTAPKLRKNSMMTTSITAESASVSASSTAFEEPDEKSRRRRRRRGVLRWRPLTTVGRCCGWFVLEGKQQQEQQQQQQQHQNRLPRVLRLVVLVMFGTSIGIILGYVLLWSYRHVQCFSREAGVIWHEGPSHDHFRPCPSVEYPTMIGFGDDDEEEDHHQPPERICITTLTEESSSSSSMSSWWQRMLWTCRNFDRVGALTWPNRQAYATKHGYTLVDSSYLVDPSRPPAWSKIRAVQSLVDSGNCDWVFWMDADTVICNSTIRIEQFLPNDKYATAQTIDLLVTYDRRFAANSGAWLMRAASPWSQQFLQQWWNMKTWVRERGLSLSGDNAAFGHLIQSKLKTADDAFKIQMVPRCTFNSFGVYQSSSSNTNNNNNDTAEVGSHDFYHKGDFVGHASGIDQKEAGVQFFLKRAQ